MVKNRYIARINCLQPIPCNPCETSCPFGAIYIGEDITNRPILDLEKCKGCGICVAACPGIAITMAMITGDAKDFVSIPYEYLPLPLVGDTVVLVDTNGVDLGEGLVEKLNRPNKKDPTTLVYVSVDNTITDRAVGIKRKVASIVDVIEVVNRIEIVDPIICRCEEIRESEIIEGIKKGDRTVEAIKRRTRSGMGLCQGKTCNRLIAGIIARESGISVGEQAPSSKRPPVGVISIREMSEE
ncbi:MAG: BFD (2Fe-2S)-binding domain-containing protein [Fusobacteria bacterium]|nr:MAG: BFD (2Fe-2S)-binding domain-containing protein [Fusobacteriota bacterium]KAF0229217.1 MAG: BFD (2Fe-2S)-binding domain-containing [Fusobacteriota bacterium]